MGQEITQRELRNESGEIMRRLDRGDSFVVTRRGDPVGELIPLRRRRFVPPRTRWRCSPEPRRSTWTVSATTSTAWPTRTSSLVPDARRSRGLLDTSVIVDLEEIGPERLPTLVAISSLTLAELAAGPHATTDPHEAARRQDRLQRTEAAFDGIPFGVEAARAYGRVYAAVAAAGRTPRGARAVDLLIAATACAEELPLYTRNGADFAALDGVVEVVEV